MIPNSKTVVFAIESETEYAVYFDSIDDRLKTYLELIAEERLHDTCRPWREPQPEQSPPDLGQCPWPGFGDDDEQFGYRVRDRDIVAQIHRDFGGEWVVID